MKELEQSIRQLHLRLQSLDKTLDAKNAYIRALETRVELAEKRVKELEKETSLASGVILKSA